MGQSAEPRAVPQHQHQAVELTPGVARTRHRRDWRHVKNAMVSNRSAVVGPIALQHHGGFKDGKYQPASSLMQFRYISIKELKPATTAAK